MTNLHAAVDSFRNAALSPADWPQALDGVARALLSDGASLVAIPTRPHFTTSSTNLRPFVQEHFKLPFPDPREARVSPGLHEGFMADHAYFSQQEISREPYYQEFLIPRGFGWNAAAALGAGLLISLKRGVRRGPYDRTEIAALNCVLPSLRAASRAARLAWETNFSGQLRAFELIGRGAILVDSQARVLEINACVRFGDGFDVSSGRLQAAYADDRHRLDRVLSAALANATQGRTGPSTCVVRRGSGLRPWLIDAIGCNEAVRSLHSGAAVLLLITDLDRATRLNHERLSEVFDLTLTEAKLADGLARGRTLQQAAADLGITVGHARQRLKTVFCKTGVSRQAELVALLAKMTSG